jgi:hypothetical protein
MGHYILAEDEQFTNFIFRISLKKAALCVRYIENTLNGEIYNSSIVHHGSFVFISSSTWLRYFWAFETYCSSSNSRLWLYLTAATPWPHRFSRVRLLPKKNLCIYDAFELADQKLIFFYFLAHSNRYSVWMCKVLYIIYTFFIFFSPFFKGDWAKEYAISLGPNQRQNDCLAH